MTRGDFADAVFTYCLITAASVTSWTRTHAHNAAVGGVETSPHLLGLGADVVYDAHATTDLRDAVAKHLALKLLHEGDHDHIQPLDWNA